MENPTIVKYFDGQSARPMQARMLLFNNAIQLYNVDENSFLAAFPCHNVKMISKTDSAVHFALLADGSRNLEIPTGHLLLPELLKMADVADKSWYRKLNKVKIPALILIFIVMVVGLYYLLVVGVSGIGLGLISPKKEVELGKMIYAAMMEDSKIDAAATRQLTNFAAHLKLSEKYKLRYTVVDEKEVNAFAIPGGHIIVYKGILQKMKKPEELVALLAHESSHVNERHSLRNMLQELTGGFVLSLVFGDLGSLGGSIAGKANTLRSLSYSRGLEEEADKKGMERMLKNEVDPRGMVMLMDRLKEAEKDLSLPGFLSTHPLTTERKANAQQFVMKHPVKARVPADLEGSWNLLKEMVAPKSEQKKQGSDW
jgi:Zn-dependent protease with chaperone function